MKTTLTKEHILKHQTLKKPLQEENLNALKSFKIKNPEYAQSNVQI